MIVKDNLKFQRRDNIQNGDLVDETMVKAASVELQVPNSQKNPFLIDSDYKQGTFYVIIFPIICGFLALYLISVLWKKIEAKRQTQGVSAAYQESIYDVTCEDNISFYHKHKRNKTQTDLSFLENSEFQQDMDNGKVLQLQQGQEVQYQFTSADAANVANNEPIKQNRHKRTPSSILLDEFIYTGELPKLEDDSFVVGDYSHLACDLSTQGYESNKYDRGYENSYILGSPGRTSSPVREYSPVRSPAKSNF